MNKLIDNILDFIKSNPDIAQDLFFYSDLNDKYRANNFSQVISPELTPNNVIWLYLTNIAHPEFVGIDSVTDEVYTVEDGYAFKLCDGFQNLPYEILLLKCFYDTDNNTVAEVLANEPEFALALAKYEAWCKANGIELDKDKVYHDHSGKLFDKYFDKN